MSKIQILLEWLEVLNSISNIKPHNLFIGVFYKACALKVMHVYLGIVNALEIFVQNFIWSGPHFHIHIGEPIKSTPIA